MRNNHFQLTYRPFKVLSGEKGVYLSTFLRSLGIRLVTIFIPIYIYNITNDLASPFLFYGITHLVVILSAIPAGWLVQRIGVDWSAFFGSVLRALFLLFFILAKNNLSFLWLGTVFWGSAVSLYWLAFHYTVVGAEYGDGYFGKEVSLIKIVEQLTSSLGPFFGGVIIASLGFNWAYGVALGLVLLAGFPMFLDRFQKKGMRFNPKRIIKNIFAKDDREIFLAFIGYGIKDVVLWIAWPLYMVLMLKSYTTVGFIETGALMISLILLWWLGKWIDKKGFKILRWGVLLNSFIWIVRAYLKTPMHVFLSNVIYAFGILFIFTPFDAMVYKLMLGKKRLEFLIIREFGIHGGALLNSFVVYFLIKLGVGWFWIFTLGAVGLLAMLKSLQLSLDE